MSRRKYTDIERKIMKGIAVNLKSLLSQRDWKQKELSEATGLSTSVISDYLTEKTLVSPGSLTLIANTLNVKKGDIDPSFSRSTNEVALLPIVSKISYKNELCTFEEINGYEETPRSWVSNGEYFYFNATDDSMMNARILDGDMVLIRKQEVVADGDIALLLINGDIRLKRIFTNGGAITLHSENPKYPPKHFGTSDDIRIIGKLKKIIINM